MMETDLEQVKRLSDSARAALESHKDAVEVRDAAIVAAHRNGAGEAALVRTSGLVASQIQGIVLRADLAAQREEEGKRRIEDDPAVAAARRR